MLCVGSPVTAWLTSRIERRFLLTATLLVLTLTNAASAFAPDYDSLLIIRMVMLAIGVLYAPQAAGTAALIVPVEKRGSMIAYIFLGWSLAAAIGLPLITLIASRYGFRATYGAIALERGSRVACCCGGDCPAGCTARRSIWRTWIDLGRNPTVILLLSITPLQMSGQFVVFTFMGPLLTKLTGANADAIEIVFGSTASSVSSASRSRHASWIPGAPGRPRCCSPDCCSPASQAGALSAGAYALMAASVAVWGLELRIDQFDAAGAPGRCSAGARRGLGLARHLGAGISARPSAPRSAACCSRANGWAWRGL